MEIYFHPDLMENLRSKKAASKFVCPIYFLPLP